MNISFKPSTASTTVQAIYGFGAALAIAISWSVNHTIPWAIAHGVCSWLYVIYYAFLR